MKQILLLVLLLCSVSVSAQVGINTASLCSAASSLPQVGKSDSR